MAPAPHRHLLLLPLLIVAASAASPAARGGGGDDGAAGKVSLALYYESLCPYSARFVVNHLARVFHDGLLAVVDLTLVPYGNARVLPNGTISCQHGPNECLLNTVEACGINAWPDLNVHFSFIYCVENLVMEHKYTEWESCFAKLGLDPKPVMDCLESGNGKKLELQYAKQTDALEPPHRYVPWVVVDGQPLYEDYENFEAYICKAYKGNLPRACEGLVLEAPKRVKSDGSVCYSDEIIYLEAEDDEKDIKMVV